MLRSALAKSHPHVRVYCALLLAGSAATWSSPYRLAAIGAIALLSAAVCGARARKLAMGIVPTASLILGVLALALVSRMPISEIKILPIAIFAARCWIAYTVAAGLSASTHYADAIAALERLRVPTIFTSVAYSICRWFEVVQDEAINANTARILRGGHLKKRLEQIKDMATISAAVMTRSYLRAERVATAMECRGFKGQLMRPTIEPMRTHDLILLSTCALIILTLWLVLP